MKKLKTYREFQFENDFVRVWKTSIAPGEPLEFHRHDAGRVVVGLQGGKLKRIDEDGTLSDLVFETDKAYWLGVDEPCKTHGDINEGDLPIEIMVIEIKEPTNTPLPSKPLE
jgi:beta-alanine degradation protein BauB